MTKVIMAYNPYKLETNILINGREIKSDSELYKITSEKSKRLQEWIGQFPQLLKETLNTGDFEIEFYGTALDFDDVKYVFEQAKQQQYISNVDLKFIEGKSDENVIEKIVKLFKELQKGPFDEFKNEELVKEFKTIGSEVFPINVIATMSSGKSTLINALLGKKLMPAKNEACTATITEILDNDEEIFTAVAYDEKSEEIRKVSDLTYAIMGELNEDKRVHRIAVEGKVPFLDAHGTALMLVDTPGPNNARDKNHYEMTYREIKNSGNNLILYVLNATQLGTQDDATLLRDISDQMREGGKDVRDRFLFVVNKMDLFDPEEESIERAVENAKKYLASFGIDDPQIFPCSAYVALNIRTLLSEMDINSITYSEFSELSPAKRKTIDSIDTLNKHAEMHLERYSTLSPTIQGELNYKLSEAEREGNKKELALIHSGIYSVEAAIATYVKKYARTKKIKELVKTFQDTLTSSKTVEEIKNRISNDEVAQQELLARAAAITAQIKDGQAAEVFKEKIRKLDPMSKIEERVKIKRKKAEKQAKKAFDNLDDEINDRMQARWLLTKFLQNSSEAIVKFTVDIEDIINKELKEAGEEIFKKYQEKLTKMDEGMAQTHLDFSTFDLIKGALKEVNTNVNQLKADESIESKIEESGTITHEEKVYFEKVGQEEKQVVTGMKKVKTGKKERKKVGERREKVETKIVEVEPTGFFGALKRLVGMKDKKVEDVYEIIDEYEEKDIYRMEKQYKTVLEDIYEERREIKEHFSVDVKELFVQLGSDITRSMDKGLESALNHARQQTDEMKLQFEKMFDDLDQAIQVKYAELNKFAMDSKNTEQSLEENKLKLSWLQKQVEELDEILDINK